MRANEADVTLHAHPKGVVSVCFDPAGEHLITAGKDGRVLVWDAATWTKRRELRFSDDGEVSAMQLSADASLLAAAGEDGRLVVYRMADGAAILDKQITAGRLFDLAWIGDTSEVAIGGDRTRLWVIDATTSIQRSKLFEDQTAELDRPDEIDGLAYIASRRSLAVCLWSGTCYFVDPVSLESQSPSLANGTAISRFCKMAPGYLATSDGPGITIWNAVDGSVVSNLNLSHTMQCMRYSDAASVLAVGFRDGSVEVCCDFFQMMAGRVWSRRYFAHTDRASASTSLPTAGGLQRAAGMVTCTCTLAQP